MSQAQRIIILALALVALIGVSIWWSAKRDAKLAEDAEKYEQCVKAEYGKSPLAYFAEHGEYPPCESN